MMWLPGAIIAGLVVAVLSLVIGHIPHDSRRTKVLNAVGCPLFTMADEGRRASRGGRAAPAAEA